MSGLLKFLPAQMVIFEGALLKGLDGAQGLLCMIAIFVLEFAEIEHQILRRLIRLSGVTEEVAKALFSGVRAEAAMDFVKRLLEISDESEDNRRRYLKAFAQFKAITEARNLILHYGLDRTSDSIVATNERIALSESRLRSVPISIEILRNLVKDLYKIERMLAVSAITSGYQEKDLPPEWKTDLIFFGEPWLYTPPQAPQRKSQKPSVKATSKSARARKDRRS